MSQASGKSNIQQQISENLKRVYDDAFDEGVPDEFAQMIERFKAEKAKLDAKKQDGQ